MSYEDKLVKNIIYYKNWLSIQMFGDATFERFQLMLEGGDWGCP